MLDTQRIGIEFVERNGLHSFRIRNNKGQIFPKMDCPLWFPTKAGAIGCSDAVMKRVTDQLRQRGIR